MRAHLGPALALTLAFSGAAGCALLYDYSGYTNGTGGATSGGGHGGHTTASQSGSGGTASQSGSGGAASQSSTGATGSSVTSATAGSGGCVPATCATLHVTCGMHPNGCNGQVDCSGVKNGAETDVDCGGDATACPTRCAQGATCNTTTDCAGSLPCVDGVCCGGTPCTACQACNLANSKGTCSLVPAGTPGKCGAALACDAMGNCMSGQGVTCSIDFGCASGFCTDNRCCDARCNDICKTCIKQGAVGSDGTCAFVVAGNTDDTCNNSHTCNGNGQCN